MAVKEILLVVDDEELNRNALSRRLERSGFEVEVADGGADALRKMAERPYDLILLDQMMPGKSGTDVLRELRMQYSQSALPVIMVTAVADSGRVAESLDLGANDYITKAVAETRREGPPRQRRTLRTGGPRRQRRPLGLGPHLQPGLLLAAMEKHGRSERRRGRKFA